MNNYQDLDPLEFTADTAGALEETRLGPGGVKVVTEVIKAVAKVISNN